jgi:hypothetical protein
VTIHLESVVRVMHSIVRRITVSLVVGLRFMVLVLCDRVCLLVEVAQFVVLAAPFSLARREQDLVKGADVVEDLCQKPQLKRVGRRG